jgi:hypothetical protein
MFHTPPPHVDLAREIPEFAALARTTVRLHPRRGEGAIGESKIGGAISWPSSEEWPICTEHDCPFVAVLQLRAADVPELGFPQGTDLFQLLWCPNDHENARPLYAPSAKIYWRRNSGIRSYLAAPSSPTASAAQSDYIPRPCILHPERVIEFPDIYDLAEDRADLVEKLKKSKAVSDVPESYPCEFDESDAEGCEDIYQSSLSVADGLKVGGYPYWIQYPEWPQCECGHRMDYLLTVASAEFDGGTWFRWLAREDRANGKFWDADFETRRAVQSAAGLMLGDMGNINYFICRRCQPWPIEGVFQCS